MEKAPPPGLPVVAKFYIAAIILMGAAGAFTTFQGWTPRWTVRLFVYLAIALTSSGMKVILPGISGSISVNYVFTLLAILQFEVADTLLLALVAVIAQTLWHTQKRPQPLQLFFNLASITLTVLCANLVYRQPWFASMPEGQLFRLMIAGVVYFVVNVLPVCIVISLTERRSVLTVWNESYQWSFPFYLAGASLAEMVHLSIERLGWTFTVALVPFLYVIYRSYKLMIAKVQQEKSHAESMTSLHLRTIEALAMAIEAKDECTHEHLRRVQVYSLKTAERLGLAPDEIRALEAASILHDIGKLAVPDYIISKPGKLTPEEFEKMKIHTVVGAKILEQVGFPYNVAPIVRSHHEKWDGSGYPDGLKGEEIPRGARILAAVDCLDALASDRQYRRALPLDEAMAYVASHAGRSFDPQVVEILKGHYRDFEALSTKAPIRIGLDTQVVVSRGGAPDAGYQKDATAPPAQRGMNEPVSAGSTDASLAAARYELQTVLELARELSGSLRLEETLALIAQGLKRLVPYDCIAIWVREGDVLIPKYVNGEGSRTFQPLAIPVGQGLSGWVVEQGKPIINGNPSVEPAYLNDPGKFSTLDSALCVRLSAEHLSGALTLYRTEKDAFDREHLRILQAVNGKISRAVECALRFQQARNQDGLDELTGLPDARAVYIQLQDELVRCQKQQKPLSVLVCDLDDFKQVNDSRGQLSGNELLKRVAVILRENCRDTDCVARMAGDEFVVLFGGAGADEINRRIELIDREIRKCSREICGDEMVGISVGVACFPDDGTDAETLLSHAENDMYCTKKARKSGNLLRLPRPVIQVA